MNWPCIWSKNLVPCPSSFISADEFNLSANSWLIGPIVDLFLDSWFSSVMKVNQMAETPIIIVSSIDTTWVSIFFPVVLAISRTYKDFLFRDHQFMLFKRWTGQVREIW